MTQDTPQIFDSKRRLAIRARGAERGFANAFLIQHMAEELAERLHFVSRAFKKVLILGPIAELSDSIMGDRAPTLTKAIFQDEEILPFPPESFDLILSAGTLDSVNDLPGALIQIRRALKPDGLFLGTMYGAGSLSKLKTAMLHADGGQVRPHIHPQIDLRAAADLMSRSGFALPVADVDMLEIRYQQWQNLVGDLRDAGAGNALSGPRAFNRLLPGRLDACWKALTDTDGRVSENFHFLQLSGWAPAPSQPKPAARGSGIMSLASVLNKNR